MYTETPILLTTFTGVLSHVDGEGSVRVRWDGMFGRGVLGLAVGGYSASM